MKGKGADHSPEIKVFLWKMSHLCHGSSLSKHLELVAAAPTLLVNPWAQGSAAHCRITVYQL